MMQITVEYTAQLKQAAGVAAETVELADAATLQTLFEELSRRHDARLKPLLFDNQGNWQRSVLIFVGDEQVAWDQPVQLARGQTVSLVAPISGG